MTKKVNLIIFHYHFLRGGVRSAILRSLKALELGGYLNDYSMNIICGRKEGLDSFSKLAPTSDLSVRVDARLDYCDSVWPNEEEFKKEVLKLAEFILSIGGSSPSLYWVHNPTLGKNPLATYAWREAVKLAFENEMPYGFLYHIHDFAECGRIENLLRLKKCWGYGGIDDFYPLYPNIRYGVLNKTDKHRLILAGIDEKIIFWLPNVVFQPEQSKTEYNKSAILSALSEFALSHGYEFSREAENWVMPIRLIRRKNVLEGIVLSMMHANPRNVLITLDATSTQEKPYANTVKETVKKLKLPAVIGFGDQLVGKVFSFEALLKSCEAVVTTSVMEGFGFAFLEGLLNGIPITGRNISFVTDDFVPAGFPSHALYHEFLVPVDSKIRNNIMDAGRKLLRKLDRIMSLDSQAKDRFAARLEEVYGKELVDFGALDLNSQINICKKLTDICLLNELASINELPKPLGTVDTDFLRKIDSIFGPKIHASRLITAFSDAINGDFSNVVGGSNISSKIMEQFLDPTYLKPLLGGWELQW